MNAKSSVFYPAVIFASLLGVVGILVLVGLQFTVTIEPSGPDTLIPEKSETSSQSLSDPPAPSDLSSSALSNPQAKLLGPVKQETIAQTPPQSPAQTATAPGTLRVSNQTDQPLRVALLAQELAANSSASKSNYGEPVHWDFAPGEGGTQGLILSLPQGDLKLKKGDILVAFAQDGSRRYWGPYVVGGTSIPIWNQKTSEWQLTLTH